MFILDFFLGGLMDQLIDWIYSQLVGFFGNFFAAMGNMGVELFDMEWVQSIVLFFSYLGWALFGVGLVVAVYSLMYIVSGAWFHDHTALRFYSIGLSKVRTILQPVFHKE